ncbi:hypothetical protein HanHA89_Chr06g0212591 [Helianthus annuus]|nr:hypothetical protein HanHA89_Chr06g0212551 [Helianthus annuus]KAJ0572149.1 hypothetical protein HanHA89_Chr06g0212591 [Helianthus annuus]
MGHLVKCVAGKSTHIRSLLSNRWSRTSSTVVVPVDAITTFVSKTDMQEKSRLQEKRYSAFKGEIQKLQLAKRAGQVGLGDGSEWVWVELGSGQNRFEQSM